jgi:hypothetical protein
MSEEALEKTSSVLPEAWYDLIARIVPGALAVFITYVGPLDCLIHLVCHQISGESVDALVHHSGKLYPK